LRATTYIFSAPVLVLWGAALLAGMQMQASAATRRPAATQNGQVQAQRDLLRRQANGIFDREMQRAKDGDCDSAATNAAINQCLTQRIAITDLNLKTYENALRGLLALEPASSSQTASSAPPVSRTQEFDQMEREWHAYLNTATTAAADQLDGGSGAASTGMMTHLQLVRGHMKELDTIYFSLLHL
jgi:hypothetical protein